MSRAHHGAIWLRPQASPVRALFTKLSHPAFPGEHGREKGAADQRGAGRRVSSRRDATARVRMIARHRKLQSGEHGPAASVQAGSRVGGNIDMKKAPGTRAPRSTPPPKRKPGISPRLAEPRGADAGGGQRTSDLGVGTNKHFMPVQLAKPKAAVCRSSLLPSRGLPPLLIRWRVHVSGLMTWTHARMRHPCHSFGNAAKFWKPVGVA